ncbi:glycogen synthase [Pedobacter glucosidilyticus]|nr:glycosyltransferase family 4 protein [Pedobacter glucosidilyticus]KHJ36975.1 glycogen synthase [Pedobacter glucosidilyticus]
MKILIFSPSFLPVIGGLENMMHYLATGLSNLNVEITVITLEKNKSKEEEEFNYNIIRKPSYITFYKLYKECDAYLNFNISLKGLWPLLIKRKPYFVSHQITYINFDGSINFLEKIKRFITRFSTNISCTDFVRQTLPLKNGYVIGNCYNNNIFKNLNLNRDLEIAFVGRLVSDKGVDTLINALHFLKQRDKIYPKLTVIGNGPELENLKSLTMQLNLNDQINFIGAFKNEELVNLLNRHKLLVIPSKWEEPFGIVALEGLACGCSLIVSKNGGLPEASGNLSIKFENGNPESLYLALKFHYETFKFDNDDSDTKEHLRLHSIKSIAKQYLDTIEKELK